MMKKLTRSVQNANIEPQIFTGNIESEIVAQTDRTSRDEQLQADAQEYNEILRQARRGLTEASLEAVMVLRREMEYRQALMDLLLEGEIEAEIPNDDGGSLTLDHFRWKRARPEQAAA